MPLLPRLCPLSVLSREGMLGVFAKPLKWGFRTTLVCMIVWQRYGRECSLFWMVHVLLAAF